MSLIFHVSVYLWMVLEQCVLLSAPGFMNKCVFTLYDWSVFVRLCLRVLSDPSVTDSRLRSWLIPPSPAPWARVPLRTIRPHSHSHRGTINSSSSPSFLVSVTHLGFILPPPSTRHPTRLHYSLLPQWVYLSFYSPVSFLRSLSFSFPFLPGSVNDLILMKHSLGGETKPHGWNLPPSLHLSKPPCTTVSGFHSQR